DVFVVAGKGEAGLLHPRAEDGAIEAVVAGDDLQRKLIELAAHQRADRRLDEIVVLLVRHDERMVSRRLETISGVPSLIRGGSNATYEGVVLRTDRRGVAGGGTALSTARQRRDLAIHRGGV